MAEYTNTPGAAPHHAGLMHTLQRHRDILQVHLILLLLSLFDCLCFLYLLFERHFNNLKNLYFLLYFYIKNSLFLCQHCVLVDFHYAIYHPLGLYARVPQNKEQLL